MNSVKAILVDDEQAALNVLSNLLHRSHPELEIVAQCHTVLQAVDAIEEHQPDVVFLDVEMPNHAGYELIHFFEEINFKIIFVTAYDQYALRAFEVCAVDYLLKPIDRQRLRQAIERLQEQLKLQRDLEHYRVLATSLEEKKLKKIIIPELGNKKVILIKDIIAMEAQRAYSLIHCMDNKKLTVSKGLVYFDSILTEEDDFYRIHKSWIINVNQLRSISKSQRIALLTEGIEAKISRAKYDDFEQRVNTF